MLSIYEFTEVGTPTPFRNPGSIVVFVLKSFWQFMRHTLVAVDAGFSGLHALLHFVGSTAALLVEVHRIVGMAVSAFPGIRRLH